MSLSLLMKSTLKAKDSLIIAFHAFTQTDE